MSENKIVSSKEVMRLLGVSKSTLKRWRETEKLPYYKISRKVFYRTDELNLWFENFKCQ